jgi:putative inorganic carbon (hco3(-)) transporter
VVYWGLLLFFIFDYVRPGEYFPPLTALRFNSIVPLFNFVGTIATRGGKMSKVLFAETNTWILAYFMFLVVISVLSADVTLYAWTGFTTVLGYVMAYIVLMSELTTLQRIRGVFMTLILVHLIILGLNPQIITEAGERVYINSGFFMGDGNDFALSLNIVVPLCLCLMLDTKRFLLKILWAGCLLGLIGCIVLTQSRGGTIALGVMAAYYWLKSDKKVTTAALVVVVIFLIFAFAPAQYFERMNMISDTSEGSANARLEAWKVGMRMAADHPLLGVGVGHFGVKFGTTYLPVNLGGPWMTAHSLYFLALGELGFPGIIFVLTFVFYNLAANRNVALLIKEKGFEAYQSESRILSSMSAALLSFAAGAAFLSCLYYPHIYVLCGMMAATRWVIRERLAESTEHSAAATPREIHVHWSLRPPALPSQGTRS